MIVTVEISYYPLIEDYSIAIDNFIKAISKKDILVDIGKMSTLIIGEFEEIMKLLTESMGELMEKYSSVFNLKISNSCPINY